MKGAVGALVVEFKIDRHFNHPELEMLIIISSHCRSGDQTTGTFRRG
jgi:hypothetical protein